MLTFPKNAGKSHGKTWVLETGNRRPESGGLVLALVVAGADRCGRRWRTYRGRLTVPCGAVTAKGLRRHSSIPPMASAGTVLLLPVRSIFLYNS